MYILVNKDYYLKALQAVCAVVEKKNTLPILSHVLFELNHEHKTAQFFASDLELQICYQVAYPQHVEKIEGTHTRFTTGAQKFYEVIRSLNTGDIALQQNTGKLTIKQDKSRFELHTLPADDFPILPKQEPLHRFKVDQKVLKHQLSSMAFAMAHQDVRYYLNASLLAVQNNTMHWVSTDGHRLACSSVPYAYHEDVQVIIPRKTIVELLRLLSDQDSTIDIHIDAQSIHFHHPQFTLSSKLIDGRFPDFTRFMQKHPHVLSLERLDLLVSLQRASILTQDKLRTVKWLLSHNTLNVFASNAEQEEVNEDVPCQYEGDAFELAFNITYWQDVLPLLKQNKLHIYLQDANTSAVLMASDAVHTYGYVVMPMKI